jgi:hypothetical protein
MYLSDKANEFNHRHSKIAPIRDGILLHALDFGRCNGDMTSLEDAYIAISALTAKLDKAIAYANELYQGEPGFEHFTLNDQGYRNPVIVK